MYKIICSFIKKFKTPAFTIDSAEEDRNTGLIFFWIKLNERFGQPVRKDPINLLKESLVKNCFSIKNYHWIIDAALENQKRLVEKKYRKKNFFIKHQYSEHLGEPLIIFKDENSKYHIKTAKEIFYSIEKLKKFSPEDSACIGNILGSYEAEKEFLFLLENKKRNST